jgi:hypothetical protein
MRYPHGKDERNKLPWAKCGDEECPLRALTQSAKGFPTMKNLSKSKLLAFRQCPRRLWLEIHRPDLREDSSATLASFAAGHAVGEAAQRLYDPKRKGIVFNPGIQRHADILTQSVTLLDSRNPIFEAGFSANGALAYADVMLPVKRGGQRMWRMVEVKSSSSVHDYHRDDVAIQSFIARRAGVPLAAISLAHIDSKWTYGGDGDYNGLLVENDLTDEAFGREREVEQWIADARKVVARRKEPRICTGEHCRKPCACGFIDYCESKEAHADYPVDWLPDVRRKDLKEHLSRPEVIDLRQVPDTLLNELQLRVKASSLSGKTWFDRKGAAKVLKPHGLPARFLDFESISLPVPLWAGTRPYQNICFQFSLHRLSRTGKLEHEAFLDLSGNNPSKHLAAALISACGERGPIFVYNASFEKGRIRELAERFPRMRRSLLAINDRVVDLHPITRDHYYHPDQEGSWSLKYVLPTIASGLGYKALDGVQDGGMAMTAWMEAVFPGESPARSKAEIDRQLRDYCKLDTMAMVRLWQMLSGRS